MPLPVPILDDRTFDQLVAESRSLIPRYSDRWTDLNLSDPGITLLELFAYLTESAIFQLDQLPEETVERFLAVAGIQPVAGGTLEDAVAAALYASEREERALSLADAERIAVAAGAQHKPRARRALAQIVPDPVCGGAAATGPFAEPADALLVALVPEPAAPAQLRALNDRVFRALKERVLLGTTVYVVTRAEIAIEIDVRIEATATRAVAPADVTAALAGFLDQLTGGAEGTGWPFGRAVFRSELFQLLEAIPGVDHVDALALRAPGRSDLEHADRVDLPAAALPALEETNVTVTSGGVP
jgi:hypothetical protein